MAEQKLDTLTVEMSIDQKKIAQSAKQVEQTIDRLTKNVTAKFTSLVTSIASAFSLDIAKNLVEGFASAGSQVYYLSQRIQENVTTIGSWEQAAKRFGGSAQQTDATLKGLYDRLNTAVFQGDNTLFAALNKIGVSAVDQNGQLKKTSDLLLDVGQALKNAPQGKRNYYAGLLGIDDATMRLITQGRSEASKYLQQAQKLGVLNQQQAQRAVILQNKLSDLNQQWSILKLNIGEKLMPVAMQFINNFLIPAINYIPQLISTFSNFTHEIGLSNDTVIKLAAGFAAFLTIAPVLGLISTGFKGITAAVGLLLSPLGKVSLALTTIYETYRLLKDVGDVGKTKNNYSNVIDPIFGKGSGQKVYNFGANLGNKLYDFFHPNSIEQSQLQQESGGRNIIGYKYLTRNGQLVKDAQGKAQFARDSQGNKIPEAYGIYQIKPSTASDVWGFNVTGTDLLNPDFNKQTRDKIYAKGLQLSGGDQKGALAYYNGGQGGLNYYKQHGVSKNNYAESIVNRASQINSLNQPQSNNTSNSNTSVNISNISLPNVKNPTDFTNELTKMQNNAWAFSNGYTS